MNNQPELHQTKASRLALLLYTVTCLLPKPAGNVCRTQHSITETWITTQYPQPCLAVGIMRAILVLELGQGQQQGRGRGRESSSSNLKPTNKCVHKLAQSRPATMRCLCTPTSVPLQTHRVGMAQCCGVLHTVMFFLWVTTLLTQRSLKSDSTKLSTLEL